MLIKDLENYVKFAFKIDNTQNGFATSDIEALKDVMSSNSLNVGDIIDLDNLKVEITNIQIKNIDSELRSNKFGISMEESLQGKLKDSLLTIVVSVSESLS